LNEYVLRMYDEDHYHSMDEWLAVGSLQTKTECSSYLFSLDSKYLTQ